MAQALPDLTQWLKRVRASTSRQEVFRLLDEFRALPWTDEQRAAMSQVYVPLLDAFKDAGSQAGNAEEDNKATDGPVWYEKM